MTVRSPAPHVADKPSKAWIGLLALGIAAILLLATCTAGVFRGVGEARVIPPSPRGVTPTTTPPATPRSPAHSGPGLPGPADAALRSTTDSPRPR